MGEPLKVWLSEADRRAVSEAAARAGMSLSAYARSKIFAPDDQASGFDGQWATDILLLLGDLLIAIEDREATETTELAIEQLSQTLALLNERTAR
ncbi:MAG: hypothetical protein AAFY57_18280 [Cyanobacteria bacterium J06642_2]